MGSWGAGIRVSVFPALAMVVGRTDGWGNVGWYNLRQGDECGRRQGREARRLARGRIRFARVSYCKYAARMGVLSPRSELLSYYRNL